MRTYHTRTKVSSHRARVSRRERKAGRLRPVRGVYCSHYSPLVPQSRQGRLNGFPSLFLPSQGARLLPHGLGLRGKPRLGTVGQGGGTFKRVVNRSLHDGGGEISQNLARGERQRYLHTGYGREK